MEPIPLKEHQAYNFRTLDLSEEDGGGILIYFPDLPGCMSDGETLQEAITNGYDAVEDWLEVRRHWGQQIPKPLFKIGAATDQLTLSNGSSIGIHHSQKLNLTDAQKTEATDTAMKEFLGV